MISLTLNYEPPFNELTRILSEKVEFNEELTLEELFEFLKKRYGEEFIKLLWEKKKRENSVIFFQLLSMGIILETIIF